MCKAILYADSRRTLIDVDIDASAELLLLSLELLVSTAADLGKIIFGLLRSELCRDLSNNLLAVGASCLAIRTTSM